MAWRGSGVRIPLAPQIGFPVNFRKPFFHAKNGGIPTISSPTAQTKNVRKRTRMYTKWVPTEVPESGTHHVILDSCAQSLEALYIALTGELSERSTRIAAMSSRGRSKTAYQPKHGCMEKKGRVEADKAGIKQWSSPTERKRQEEALKRRRTLFCDYVMEEFAPTWLNFSSDGRELAAGSKRKHREYLAHLSHAFFSEVPPHRHYDGRHQSLASRFRKLWGQRRQGRRRSNF